MNFKFETHKKFEKNQYEYYIMGADIGGTNTRIGFAGIKNQKFYLLFTITYPSHSFKSLAKVINHAKSKAKETFGISVKRACIAAAGPITNNRNTCIMTNTPWNVERKSLIAKTRIKILPLINDLESAGYSIEHIKKDKLINLTKKNPKTKFPKLVIAAGTGLGISIVTEKIVLPSEGGHSTLPITDTEEMELAEFIKKQNKIKTQLQYEHLVSGPGIARTYEFYASKYQSKHKKEIIEAPNKTFAVTKYLNKDEACRKTMKTFIKMYARFAKDSSLGSIPIGGIYLAGSISKNNVKHIKNWFLKEFLINETHQKLLKSFPIFILTNDDAGLLGACAVALRGVNK